MSRISLLTTAALCLLLLAGCAKPYVYLDNKDVEIDSITHTADGDFLVVRAVLKNADNDDVQNSVYRVLWFDGDGAMIEQTAWRPVIVKGAAPVYIQERSTVPGAKDYKLLISNDARKP